MFSPHTRGCSFFQTTRHLAVVVFPAYAGMFLPCRSKSQAVSCFPRIRGDVPDWDTAWHAGDAFSPHTRGCSPDLLETIWQCAVFPAYAGMFRASRHVTREFYGFPRIRGDVPHAATGAIPSGTFSPHTRGCSHSQPK